MRTGNRFIRAAVGAAIASAVAMPLGATTLVRASLEELAAANRTIVAGEVLDVASYWNEDGTFILTDVLVDVIDVIKGNVEDRQVKVTLMGGTIGDLTTLILGGAELIPGRTYVLFLNEEDLPGASNVLTVRDHCQGAFDVISLDGELRAISQASDHPLAPNAVGDSSAVGGPEGFRYQELVGSLRTIVNRPQSLGKGVKP